MDRGAFTLPALAAIVLVAIGASEALTKPKPPDGKVHVTYWEKWTGFEFDAMKHVVDEFNRSQDKIQVDITSVSNIEDKTLMAISGKIPPDVVGLYGTNVTQYVDDHAIMPLDDMCRQAGISGDQYVPVFWNIGVIRGHIYALPTTPASVGLHFNKDILQQAGFDPNHPPQTWKEVMEMSKKILKRDANGKVKLAGFLPAEPGWWNWSWGELFGGKIMEGDRVTINSPENVRGYEYVQSYSKAFGASQITTFRSGFGSFSSPQNGFLAGELAMVPQGVWMYNFITQFSPNLKWGAAPLPHPADRPDLANSTIIDLDILCIPVGARHVKEAFEFMKFVQSQKGMEMLCLGQKKASPLRKVSAEFYAKHPNPYIKMFADLAYSKNAVYVPKIGIWNEFNNEINAMFDDIVLMNKEPKQALDELQVRMQAKVDQYYARLKQRGEQ